MATMISGLGGASGYGENDFKSQGVQTGNLDDGSIKVDVTSVFGEEGLNLFGTNYTDIYINTNGLITFEGPNTSYIPSGISGLTQPAIAPFWTDIDISEGGNIYWDVDPSNGTVTVTWVDTAPYIEQGTDTNSFQVVLTDTGGGDFDIDFIYENIEFGNGWGDQRSAAAEVGITDGGDTDFELEGSGDEAFLENYETNDFDNGDFPGTYSLSVVNGTPSNLIIDGTSGNDDMGVGFLDLDGDLIGDGADRIMAGAGDDNVDGGGGNDTTCPHPF